ncbi:MAG: hypothetical protein WDW36_003098 [Sanguina aurantia]
MADIARMASNPDKYDLIMGILDQRLSEREENWRLCYKALLLLEFLCKQGPYRVADELARSVATFERLADNFTYKDVSGRDQGINVRQRAAELVSLLSVPGKLQAERDRASKNAGKYTGLSSDSGRAGGMGSDNISSGGYGSQGFGSHDARRAEVSRPSESSYSRGQDNAQSKSSYSQGSGASNNGGGGGGGPYDSGRSGGFSGAAAKDEDPFEATRRRIEKVKQEGAQPEPVSSAAFRAQAAAAAAADAEAAAAAPTMPFAEVPKVTKKMKDVKVNPAFAATFAILTTLPTRTASGLGFNSSNLLDMMDNPSAPSTHHPSQPQAASVPDLFGSLTSGTAPSSTHQTHPSFGLDSLSFQDSGTSSAAAAAAPVAAADDMWGGFHTTAPAAVSQPALQTAASGGGTRLAFGTPAPPRTAAPSMPAAPLLTAALSLDDFADAFGPMAAAPAPSHPAWGAAPASTHTSRLGQGNSMDPFASLASSSSGSAPQPMSSGFPAFTQAAAASSFDPFSHSPAPSMGGAPPSWVPEVIASTNAKFVPLGSVAPRSKDPFADILGGL